MIRTSVIALSAVLALPVGAVMASAALAPPATAPAVVVIEGTVKNVDTKAMNFVVTSADKKETTVKMTKDTKYWLDSRESTLDKVLVAGHTVKVSHTDGTASKVEYTTPKKPA